jgi:hypothetical protein
MDKLQDKLAALLREQKAARRGARICLELGYMKDATKAQRKAHELEVELAAVRNQIYERNVAQDMPGHQAWNTTPEEALAVLDCKVA